MLGCGNSSKKLLPLMELALHLERPHTFSDQLFPSTFLLERIALSEDMYDDGYHNIVNIDFSKTVIENMTIKCKDRVGMECKEDSDQTTIVLP